MKSAAKTRQLLLRALVKRERESHPSQDNESSDGVLQIFLRFDTDVFLNTVQCVLHEDMEYSNPLSNLTI